MAKTFEKLVLAESDVIFGLLLTVDGGMKINIGKYQYQGKTLSFFKTFF